MRKRKNAGRLLSILLCLMMVLGMLPAMALADEPEALSTGIPFQVKSTDESGNPLVGIKIKLFPVPEEGEDPQPAIAEAITDSDGIATFDKTTPSDPAEDPQNISPGQYTVWQDHFSFTGDNRNYMPDMSYHNVTVTGDSGGSDPILTIVNPSIVYDLTIPVEKLIQVDGKMSFQTEFEFQLCLVTLHEEDGPPVIGDVLDSQYIQTDRDGKSEALTFSFLKSKLSDGGTLALREANRNEPGWTYSEELYIINSAAINALTPDGVPTPLDENGRYHENYGNIYISKLPDDGNTTPVEVEKATFTNIYTSVPLELPITKIVEMGGNAAPGRETFTFELLRDTGNEASNGVPIYQLLDTAEITTNGAGSTDSTLELYIPKSIHDGEVDFAHIYLREQTGRAAGWNYSEELYYVNRSETEGNYTYSFDREVNHEIEPGGMNLNKATFTNIYTGYEIPFTKTVKLGGNAAPGREMFELEFVQTGVGFPEDYADVYTASVLTNGKGDFEGKLIISGLERAVSNLLSEGFFVREKDSGAANWTYDETVWYIAYKPISPDPDSGIIGGPIPPPNIPPNVTPEETEPVYGFVVYPAVREETPNGTHYYFKDEAVEKMTFTNLYTRHSSGGGGSTGATITANKTDAQGKALAGATFVLEDSRGREAYQATSNTSGTVRFADVSSGTYTLIEKKAPEGYVLSNETYTLTVSGSRVTMNGKAYSPVTFINRKAAELNRTDHFAFLVGYTDGTFGPERNMTRAEVTTMFARLLTEQIEADKTYSNTFSDVPKGYWAANYIGYMQQFGIITGYSDGSFRPDAPVTRAEFAAIASRFEKLTEGSKSFTDVPNTYWAARYINFAATRGWVTGYSDGTFKPENPITRAEVAAVTCRLLERSADQSYIRSHLKELRTFADMTESHWAYWYAMEAANGHDYTKSGGSESWSRTYR
mgnify:CR=1 FL=1